MTVEEVIAHAENGGRFRINGMPAVAWRFAGLHYDQVYNYEEGTYDQVATDVVDMIMVGDDTKHTHDPYDCEPIKREDYCSECGQIGCGHDGYER